MHRFNSPQSTDGLIDRSKFLGGIIMLVMLILLAMIGATWADAPSVSIDPWLAVAAPPLLGFLCFLGGLLYQEGVTDEQLWDAYGEGRADQYSDLADQAYELRYAGTTLDRVIDQHIFNATAAVV